MLAHGDGDACTIGKFYRPLVSGVSVPDDAHSRVSGEHPFDASRCFRCTICHYDLACMEAVTYPYTPAMVHAHPRCAADRVQHCIQVDPIRYCVRSIEHCFSLAVW